MSLTNPPPAVTALRDMLLACSSVTGASITTNSIDYPTNAINTESGTPEALPRILLAETDSERARYAEIGVIGLPAGTLIATIQADLTAGEIETLARSVASDLTGLASGLFLSSVSVGLCSDPATGMEGEERDTAGASHRTITLTITHGLRA